MTQEQKAKAYDEAKYIMKKYLKSGNAGVIAENTIKKAFPELKESEGERVRMWLISYFKYVCDNVSEKEKKGILAWLEKQGEKSADNIDKPWSEDDENRINRLIAYFEDKESFTAEVDVVYANWLKSLKDRVQPKQEWSEEDEKYINDLIAYFAADMSLKHTEEDIVNWLRSLRPQNTWKPSDEQMRELSIVATGKGWFSKEIVSELLEQLKKLKEE